MTSRLHDRSSPALLAVCASASALFSLAMLHRWGVSALGLKSYGRVWFYYVSYTDFGFTRRSLLGTLMTISRANRLVSNPYVLAYVVHSIAIFLLVALITGVFLRNRPRTHPLLLLVTFFSPALIIQSGYNTGALDIYLLIVVVLCIFYARSIAALTIGLVVGSLIHELFIFTIPSLLLLRTVGLQDHDGARARALRQLIVPAVAVAATLFCLRVWGTVTLPIHTYQAIVAAKIPGAAYQHPFWSGWYEVTGTLSDHLKYGRELPSNIPINPVWLLMLIYLGALVALQLVQARRQPVHRLLAVSTMTPLLVCLIAGDFFRWIGMSCSLALLTLLWLVLSEGEKFPRTYYFWLLPFSLLAPFGTVDPAAPFPLIHLALQRVGG